MTAKEGGPAALSLLANAFSEPLHDIQPSDERRIDALHCAPISAGDIAGGRCGCSKRDTLSASSPLCVAANLLRAGPANSRLRAVEFRG